MRMDDQRLEALSRLIQACRSTGLEAITIETVESLIADLREARAEIDALKKDKEALAISVNERTDQLFKALEENRVLKKDLEDVSPSRARIGPRGEQLSLFDFMSSQPNPVDLALSLCALVEARPAPPERRVELRWNSFSVEVLRRDSGRWWAAAFDLNARYPKRLADAYGDTPVKALREVSWALQESGTSRQLREVKGGGNV